MKYFLGFLMGGLLVVLYVLMGGYTMSPRTQPGDWGLRITRSHDDKTTKKKLYKKTPVLMYPNLIVIDDDHRIRRIPVSTGETIESVSRNMFGNCDGTIIPEEERYQALCLGPESSRGYALRKHRINGIDYWMYERYETESDVLVEVIKNGK